MVVAYLDWTMAATRLFKWSTPLLAAGLLCYQATGLVADGTADGGAPCVIRDITCIQTQRGGNRGPSRHGRCRAEGHDKAACCGVAHVTRAVDTT